MKTCNSCVYWNYKDINENDYAECDKHSFLSFANNDDYIKLIHDEVDDYQVQFRSKGDFGCVSHKNRK